MGAFSIGRLKYTFVKIVKTIVSPERPLVVLLDDLQYAASYLAFEDFLMDIVSQQAGLFFLAGGPSLFLLGLPFMVDGRV